MQPAMTILNNEFITLYYLPERKIIYHIIHQPIPFPQLIEALDLGGGALKEHGACKWLSDDRLNGPLAPQMKVNPKDWGASLVAAGWKYWANVVPAEIAAAGTLIPVMDGFFEVGLRMMVFTNVEEAFAWLAQF